MVVKMQYLSCYQSSDSHFPWVHGLSVMNSMKMLIRKLYMQAKIYVLFLEIHKYPQLYLKTLNDEQGVSRHSPNPQGVVSLQMGNHLPYVFFSQDFISACCCTDGSLESKWLIPISRQKRCFLMLNCVIFNCKLWMVIRFSGLYLQVTWQKNIFQNLET